MCAIFGAVGGGTAKDTAAIQQAIDRCWVLGGGEVRVPPGNYLTGALELRSNTILRLEKDATILGSPDFADYPVSQVRWEGTWIPGHVVLIYAFDSSHLGVIGPGKIAGNSAIRGALLERLLACLGRLQIAHLFYRYGHRRGVLCAAGRLRVQ
jgi:polygalacturonase